MEFFNSCQNKIIIFGNKIIISTKYNNYVHSKLCLSISHQVKVSYWSFLMIVMRFISINYFVPRTVKGYQENIVQ